MELRQLRYFLVLAEELNFSKAAARLNMSQPPLSVQIAQLESELDVVLFRRTSRKVELTEAGRVFQTHVAKVVADLSEGIERTRAVEEGVAGHLDIGLSGSHFHGPLPELIRHYSLSFPNVAIALHEMQPSQHLEALRRGRLDLSISRAEVNDDLLYSALLWRDPAVAVFPAGHPLLSKSDLSLSDLRSEPFVFLKPGSSVFAQKIYGACIGAGFTPMVAQYVVEVPAQLRLVASGLGLALVPCSVCSQVAGIHVRELTDELPSGDVYAIRSKNRRFGVLEAFVAHAQRFAEQGG